MRLFSEVFKEATLGSIVFVLLGLLFKKIFIYFNLWPKISEKCADWNKNHILEIYLFFLAFGCHLLFEYSPFGNINKLYCVKKFCIK